MTDIADCRRAILDHGTQDNYHLANAATYLPTISDRAIECSNVASAASQLNATR